MKNIVHPYLAFLLLVSGSTAVRGQGFVVSSLEQYSFQVGDSTTAIRSFDGFDDIDGFDNVTALTLSINGGTPENIPFDSFYEAFKRGVHYDTLAEMLAERPVDGTYTHNLSGDPSGSVTITAPGIPYGDAIPVDPVFTISGVSGTWAIAPSGIGRFYFDPDSVTEFTLTMNAYAANTQGGHYAYAVLVAEVSDEFNEVDEYHSDLVVFGETPPVPANLTLTFTKGLDLNAGDDDPSTYGFVAGTRFELEGEHVNIFGLSDAGLGAGVGLKAFVYQTVTAIELVAIADPLSELPVATGVEVTGTSSSEGSFALNWQTTPAEAAVDVYRSDDLVTWGSPVSGINASGSYTEAIPDGSNGFFVVVPSGTPYPPAE